MLLNTSMESVGSIIDCLISVDASKSFICFQSLNIRSARNLVHIRCDQVYKFSIASEKATPTSAPYTCSTVVIKTIIIVICVSTVALNALKMVLLQKFFI